MELTQTDVEVVREAIRMHSSPSIDRSDAHGCRGQAAYHVVENHVVFIAGEIKRKLGRPHRSGSNPFLNLAEDYDLPYEVVVCYAQRIREVAQNPDKTRNPAHSVWGEWALQRALRIMNERGDPRFGEFHREIIDLIDPCN